jgi:hypothetical protein
LDYVDRYIQVSWSEMLGGRPYGDAWSPWADPQLTASYRLASPASRTSSSSAAAAAGAGGGKAGGGIGRGTSDGSGSGSVPVGKSQVAGERHIADVVNVSVAQLKVIMGAHTLTMLLQLTGSMLPVSEALQVLIANNTCTRGNCPFVNTQVSHKMDVGLFSAHLSNPNLADTLA